jgi:hypothetical protein
MVISKIYVQNKCNQLNKMEEPELPSTVRLMVGWASSVQSVRENKIHQYSISSRHKGMEDWLLRCA